MAKAGLSTEDTDIISDSLWAIGYLSDTPYEETIDAISQSEVLMRIIDKLGASDLSLFVPAVRCVGNILTASDPSIVERCLFCGVLDKLTNILYQSNSNIIKECLWGFSNITAGPSTHVAKFVESDAFDRILFLCESTNIDIRKESLFVMANAVTQGDMFVRSKIYEKSCGKILLALIQATYINDARLRNNSLDAIDDILKLTAFYQDNYQAHHH